MTSGSSARASHCALEMDKGSRLSGEPQHERGGPRTREDGPNSLDDRLFRCVMVSIWIDNGAVELRGVRTGRSPHSKFPSCYPAHGDSLCPVVKYGRTAQA